METQEVWEKFNDELYFFILKKVSSKYIANDVFQSTFLKIHKNLPSLKKDEKVRAWIFQIARNEIVNYFNNEAKQSEDAIASKVLPLEQYQHICCFDKFIDSLPEIYKEVIELVYIEGLKQKDAAVRLEISLENVKARIRRGKEILKKNFNKCCKYEFDENGKLSGEANCAACKSM